jgi:hypothetical protein
MRQCRTVARDETLPIVYISKTSINNQINFKGTGIQSNIQSKHKADGVIGVWGIT